MPSQSNINKPLAGDYFEVYNKGTGGKSVFIDEKDYCRFKKILEKYLSIDNSPRLLAYYIASDHFHLLLCQTSFDAVTKLLDEIKTDYKKYFDNKYSTGRRLFNSERVSLLLDMEDSILHVSRSIHCSDEEWIDYPHSSIRAYLYDDTPKWLSRVEISSLYGSAVDYLEFLET